MGKYNGTFDKGLSALHDIKNSTSFGKPFKLSPFYKKAMVGSMVGIGALKIAQGVNNRINSALNAVYPENMLPTMKGKFGKRTDGLQQSPTQGVKFNFRRD